MIKQNPFSIYDFLGYFIPGALVLYILILIINSADFESISSVFTILGNNKTLEINNILFFVILSYALGHLVNFTSSITIERYANWKYSYPSKYLMNFKSNQKYWRGSTKIKVWKTILAILIFPITFQDYILGELLNFKEFYTRKADDFIIEMVKMKGLVLLDKLGSPITNSLREYDYHRIFTHYVYENSINHQSKMSNYVALYGFLRTLCFISVIFFWFLLYKVINQFLMSDSVAALIENLSTLFLYFILNSLTSYLFFMAFMKFYRRYSLEGLMLIVIDKDLVPNSENRKIMEE